MVSAARQKAIDGHIRSRARGLSQRIRRRRDRLALFALAAPAIIWFGAFMLWPLVDVFLVSTRKWDSLLDQPTPIGLANFRRMLHDDRFWTATTHTGVQVLVSMLAIPIAFYLGFFLSRHPRGYRTLSVILFTPAITAVTAKSVMFTGLFLPDGMVNAILGAVGLDRLQHLWLGDPSTVMPVLIALDLWAGIGFYAVLFRIALEGIPKELYEAAELDGATPSRSMVRIALPLSKGFVGVAATLHFLYLLLGSAQNVLLITKGGPGDSSLTLPYYLYDRAFVSNQIGYSQAIAVVLFVLGLAGMLIIRASTRKTYAL